MGGRGAIVFITVFALIGTRLHIRHTDLAIISVTLCIGFITLELLNYYFKNLRFRRVFAYTMTLLLIILAFLSGWTLGQGGSIVSPLIVVPAILCFGAWIGAIIYLVRAQQL